MAKKLGACLIGFLVPWVIFAIGLHVVMVPHPGWFQDQTPPPSRLGLPYGTFAVIEGVQHPTGMRLGMDGFAVEVINGKKLDHIVKIETNWWSSRFPQAEKRINGKRYVLHGYETGGWAGTPYLPTSEHFFPSQLGFCYLDTFIVTSIEKVDGVMVPDARPVDPAVPLAQPHFEPGAGDNLKEPMAKEPIGVLGLNIGSFAIIVAHPVKADRLHMFQIDKLNGSTVWMKCLLEIPQVDDVAENEQVTLHGFESAAWENTPVLPLSEDPAGSHDKPPFEYVSRFYVTSREKGGR